DPSATRRRSSSRRRAASACTSRESATSSTDPADRQQQPSSHALGWRAAVFRDREPILEAEMSDPAASGASPRLPLPLALVRLAPFAKKDFPRILLGGLSALGASIVVLLIPTALEWIVGGPIASGATSAVVWGAVAVLVLGLVEAGLVWLRRWLVLAPATAIEYNVRTAFYNRLQKLPIEFHDRWQGGQLLSRMMQDIGLIRRWMAFGLIMLVVNLITVVIGSVMLFQWHWLLGTIFVVSGIPLWIHAYRFEDTYGTLARKSQDQQGDIATSVEESVHGIRVLK